jgi:hypothetical protein
MITGSSSNVTLHQFCLPFAVCVQELPPYKASEFPSTARASGPPEANELCAVAHASILAAPHDRAQLYPKFECRYLPAVHSTHTAPSSPENPALHWHAVSMMLPAGETELARQGVQSAGPSPALYVPGKHCGHVPPSAPENPALHWHAVSIMLPTAETELPGQSVQVAGPGSDLYVPASHCEHVPPFGPVYPALQLQPVMAALPATEPALELHAVHSRKPEAARRL